MLMQAVISRALIESIALCMYDCWQIRGTLALLFSCFQQSLCGPQSQTNKRAGEEITWVKSRRVCRFTTTNSGSGGGGCGPGVKKRVAGTAKTAEAGWCIQAAPRLLHFGLHGQIKHR